MDSTKSDRLALYTHSFCGFCGRERHLPQTPQNKQVLRLRRLRPKNHDKRPKAQRKNKIKTFEQGREVPYKVPNNGIIRINIQKKRVSAIKDLIRQIKKGNEKAFMELYECFRPLIIAWLKQSKELYQPNHADYESAAKVVLYESAKAYDEGRGVPFESFYKIKLYHWYANHKRKKHFTTVQLTEAEHIQEPQEEKMAERKTQVISCLSHLTETQSKIIMRLLEGFTEAQIADELKLSKKTIQNKKYEAIAKLKTLV